MTGEGETEIDRPPVSGDMPDPGKEVIVLEPGDEQAQKIAKAMGSQTAGDILQLLKTGPKTSTEVTETLQIPMGTAKYHIENLLDAGLIEITKTRYSVKGREVKIYGLKDQLVIVTPRIANVRSILLKYASLFGVMIVATAVIGAILQMVSPVASNASYSRNVKVAGEITVPSTLPLENASGGAGAGYAAGVAQNIVPSPTMNAAHDMIEKATVAPPGSIQVPVSLPIQDILLAFFLGGCLVIAVLVVWDVYQRKRKKAG
ncbi:MAG TPA: helix-turn-helix domain-containing protein [Methanoregulaceae archaeon]|nr:helix-turn-helix domain-containing protein [Methanoregulaceae archaeon]